MLLFLRSTLYDNYWNLTGRANRKEFWLFFALQAFMSGLCFGVYYFYMRWEQNFMSKIIFITLSILYFLITFVPTISVHVRRLHDAGKSGWWHPYGLNFIIMIVLFLLTFPFIVTAGLVIILFFEGNFFVTAEIIKNILQIIYLIGAIAYIPFVLTGFVFLFFKSEKGTNKWGVHPNNYYKSFKT